MTESCPSCKSDNWKSAKRIVLEGTFNTKGDLSGKSTNPGKLSGGFREFILADRWFSLDSPMNADIEMTTKSGLVEEIRRLMLANSSLLQMPKMPEKPIPFEIKKPSKPEKLKDPTPPVIPTPPIRQKDKIWHAHFVDLMIKIALYSFPVILVISYFSNSIFGVLFGSAIWLIFLPINFYRSFSENKKLDGMHLKNINYYNSRLKIFENDLLLHNEKCRLNEKIFKESSKLYDIEIQECSEKESNYINLLRKFEINYEKYNIESKSVMKMRELLWENSRVCTRCGTAYVVNDI